MDLKLENTIKNDLFLLKNNNIENEIKELLEQKEKLKNSNFKVKTQIMLELAWSFYTSYFNANNEWKAYIIKNLMFELFISNKKELKIEESPLFKSSKILNFSFGTPTNTSILLFISNLSNINLNNLKEFHKFIKWL